MKKLVCLLLAVILLPVYALADVDLTGMTFDELVALRDQINLAMWSCEDWQEVDVPQGVWLVGQDIPAGRWVVRTNASWATVRIGTALNASGQDIDIIKSDFYYGESLTSPDDKNYDPDSDKAELELDLQEGFYVVINQGRVIFSPYSGKPSLGFK